MRNNWLPNFFGVMVLLLMTGCVHRSVMAPEDQTLRSEEVVATVMPTTNRKSYSDPLEQVNRVIWSFNYEWLDPLLWRPMAIAWQGCVPHPLRQGIINVLSNIDEIAYAINYLLITDFHQSLEHIARFSINTVLGFAGVLDVASRMGLPKKPDYSLGQVLGYYQIPSGPYLVLPFYGPSALRQLAGQIPEQSYYFPFTMLTLPTKVAKVFLQNLEKRSQLLAYDSILQQSLDSYLTVREAYFQRLQFSIEENSKPSEKSLEEEETLSTEVIEQLD